MSDGPTDRIGQHFKLITADLKRYAEKRIELIALNIGEQFSRMIAQSAQKIAGLVFIFGALIFLLVALALYVGALLNSLSLGFVLVSIPFLICGYFLVKLKPASITRKIQAGFEQELIDMVNADFSEGSKEQKLIADDSQELKKKKEHDV